jgi:hypothetical protein
MLKIVNNVVVRPQTVVVNGIRPNTVPITSVVPQGIALGPILFFMYINGFPASLTEILKQKITVYNFNKT